MDGAHDVLFLRTDEASHTLQSAHSKLHDVFLALMTEETMLPDGKTEPAAMLDY